MLVAAVDRNGDIRQRLILAMEAERGFLHAVDRLIQAIEGLLAQVQWSRQELAGIGIGCAGPVDPLRGLINNPHTLVGWNRCDIVTPLARHFGVRVHLENDADAAVLGECWKGAGRGFSPVVMLTFGTGVGGGALIDGRILRGANGEHPEMGHLPVAGGGRRCYCGASGCLESLASGTAIGEAGAAAGLGDAAQVFVRAARGEADAGSIVARALDAAATAAWILSHTLLPQRLILGGGLMDKHYALFASAVNQRMASATQFSFAACSVTPAALGNSAGVVGAASLCFQPSPATRD